MQSRQSMTAYKKLSDLIREIEASEHLEDRDRLNLLQLADQDQENEQELSELLDLLEDLDQSDY